MAAPWAQQDKRQNVTVYLRNESAAKAAGPLIVPVESVNFRWLKGALKQHLNVDLDADAGLTLTARSKLGPVTLDGDVALQEFVEGLQLRECLRVSVEGGGDMFQAVEQDPTIVSGTAAADAANAGSSAKPPTGASAGGSGSGSGRSGVVGSARSSVPSFGIMSIASNRQDSSNSLFIPGLHSGNGGQQGGNRSSVRMSGLSFGSIGLDDDALLRGLTPSLTSALTAGASAASSAGPAGAVRGSDASNITAAAPGASRRDVPSGSGYTISDVSFGSGNGGFMFGDLGALSNGSNVAPGRSRRAAMSIRHGGPMVNNMVGAPLAKRKPSPQDTAALLAEMADDRAKAAADLCAKSEEHKKVYDRLHFLLYDPSKLHSPDYDAAMSFTAGTDVMPAQIAFNELLAKLGRAARGNVSDPWLIKSVRGRAPKCVQLLRLTCRQYHLSKWGAVDDRRDPQAPLKLSLSMERFTHTLDRAPNGDAFVRWLVRTIESLMVLKRPAETFEIPSPMVEAMASSLDLKHFHDFHCENCGDIQGWRRCRKCYKEAKKRAAKAKQARQKKGDNTINPTPMLGRDGRPISDRTLRNMKLRPRSLGRQNVTGMPGVRDRKIRHVAPGAMATGGAGAAASSVPMGSDGSFVVNDPALFGGANGFPTYGGAPTGASSVHMGAQNGMMPPPPPQQSDPSRLIQDGGRQHGSGHSLTSGIGHAVIVPPVLPAAVVLPTPLPQQVGGSDLRASPAILPGTALNDPGARAMALRDAGALGGLNAAPALNPSASGGMSVAPMASGTSSAGVGALLSGATLHSLPSLTSIGSLGLHGNVSNMSGVTFGGLTANMSMGDSSAVGATPSDGVDRLSMEWDLDALLGGEVPLGPTVSSGSHPSGGGGDGVTITSSADANAWAYDLNAQ